MKNLIFVPLCLLFINLSFAQSVEEITTKYQEAIGGKKWDAINGMRMNANVDQGGMKIPIEVVSMRDGRSYTRITFMGNTMTMGAFDGTKSWTTSFMTMEPEESPADDTENAKRTAKDFPTALFNYKNWGYSASLLGSEAIEGTDCFKIKLEKKTMLVEGKEVPNIEFYYIEKENFVPIMMESEIQTGEMKGKIAQTKFSDYQEVGGVTMFYSTTQGLKDGESQTIQFDKIEMNPKVDESYFAFPKK